MLEYIIRLAIMIPLFGGMIWGSLWLWRKTQLGLGPVQALRRQQSVIEVIDAAMMGNGARVAVLRYRSRELVVAINRTQMTLLTDQPLESAHD
jgi:flagellar protein FliO/FliZ